MEYFFAKFCPIFYGFLITKSAHAGLAPVYTCIFWGLQTLRTYQLTKPNFSDLGYLSGHVLSKMKSVTPNFFVFLAIVYKYLYAWQVFKKNMCVGTFGHERP